MGGLHDQVYDAVRAEIEQKPQRAGFGPWRMLTMNKFVAIGLGAVAVVAVLFIGAQLTVTPIPGGPNPTESAAPSEAPASVEPSAEAFLPEGTFAWFEPATPPEPGDGPPITVTIPASGWTTPRGVLSKGDDDEGDLWMAGDLPESALLVESTTAGIIVFEDACQWEYNDPPATTADEIAAALAAQPSRNASDPVDVTVGGYPGKVITLHVPDDAALAPDAGAFIFADCFRGIYASYRREDWASLPTRVHQGPGQIDTFWIVDVDGAIVIIDAMYRPDTSAERIEEMRSIAESATFE